MQGEHVALACPGRSKGSLVCREHVGQLQCLREEHDIACCAPCCEWQRAKKMKKGEAWKEAKKVIRFEDQAFFPIDDLLLHRAGL